MDSTVIIALISLFGTFIGTLGGILTTSRLTNYRVEQLEKQVAKHNSIVERTYALETRAEVQEKELKYANERIDDLEKRKGDLS